MIKSNLFARSKFYKEDIKIKTVKFVALEPNRKKRDIYDGLWPPSQLAICNGKLKYFKNPGHFLRPFPHLLEQCG